MKEVKRILYIGKFVRFFCVVIQGNVDVGNVVIFVKQMLKIFRFSK